MMVTFSGEMGLRFSYKIFLFSNNKPHITASLTCCRSFTQCAVKLRPSVGGI